MGRMWFSRARPARSRDEQLAAKPLRAMNASTVPQATGGAQVSLPVQARRLFKMPAGTRRSFELDEIGLFVWERCDGRQSIEQILRALASQYNLNLREAEVATFKFLEMLARRG